MIKRTSTVALILVIISAGAIAGLVHGAVNMVLINPYLESAIEIENGAMFAAGEAQDTPEFRAEYEAYREWQRGGHILAGVILGVAMGSLFGAVFVASRALLPGKSHITKALFLAGVMWIALYLIPFLKYPPNPPAVGDPETIVLRTMLYVILVAASGLGALLAGGVASRLVRVRGLAPFRGACAGAAIYATIVLVLLLGMPASPDPAPAMEPAMLDGFRAASMAGVASFWVSVAVLLGLFWSRFVSIAGGLYESINSDSKY